MSLLSPDFGYLLPQFTAAQMEELHVQALIFKHMLMGVPVPADLHLAVRRSFDAVAATRLYHQHHPFLRVTCSSHLGKKFDPEPWRCRRTDGKKWRCANEVYADLKYCERHMRRNKSRSRKLVEARSQLQLQQSTAAETLAALLVPSGGSGSDRLGLQTMNTGNGQLINGVCPSQMQFHSGAYEMNDKDLRYHCGIKAKAGEHIQYTEASKSAAGLHINSIQNNPWGFTHSPMPSFSSSDTPTGFIMENNQYQNAATKDLDRASINLLQKHNQIGTSMFGHEFVPTDPLLQSQSLRPFFDEWPNSRSSWLNQEESKSSNGSFSTT